MEIFPAHGEENSVISKCQFSQLNFCWSIDLLIKAISIKKFQQIVFLDIDKLILMFIWRSKRQDRQHNIEGEEKTWMTDRTRLQDLL